jgi:hypothetical protein
LAQWRAGGPWEKEQWRQDKSLHSGPCLSKEMSCGLLSSGRLTSEEQKAAYVT